MVHYHHMAFSAGAERHTGTSYPHSYPIAMLFWFAGDAVIRMEERQWPHLEFATNADAAAYAADCCRVSIDTLKSTESLRPARAS